MRIFNILKKFVGYVEACVLTHAVFYFIGLGSTDVHRRNVPMTPEMIVPLPTSEQRNAVHARIKTGVSHVS